LYILILNLKVICYFTSYLKIYSDYSTCVTCTVTHCVYTVLGVN